MFPPRHLERDPLHMARLYAANIPDSVRKAIDNSEFNDRIVEAVRLGVQASDPSLSAPLRQAAKLRAQALMCAQPRDVTRRQHADLIRKAQAAPPALAASYRRQAEQLLEEKHPIAPSSSRVRKQDAGDDGPIAVFDANGNLIGVVLDPTQMTPFNSAYAPAQVPDATPDDLDDCPPDGMVAKSARGYKQVGVYDQRGRRFAVNRGAVRKLVRPAAPARVAKAVPVKGLIQVTDEDGRTYWADPANLKGPGSPEAQARNTGPVTAGGTTGMGQPRATGPAAALPLDGPQARRPGDVADRTVVKAGWVDVHTSKGKLAGVIKSAHLIQPTPGAERNVRADGGRKFCAVHDAAGRRVGYAYRANLRPARVARMAAVLKSAGVDVSGPHVFAPDALSAAGNCVCGEAPGDSLHGGAVAKTAARPGKRAASPRTTAVRVAKAAITWPDWLVS